MLCEVHVSNIGCVYSGSNKHAADSTFDTYVEKSKSDVGGRAAGESVVLLVNGNLSREFIGTQETWERGQDENK